MTVKDPFDNEAYKIWPFRPDLENGRTNIGAIDLTKEPERINEIHELSETPKLRDAIYQLNKEQSAFMTLGCLIEKDPDKEIWWSYIQFCFRPSINVSQINQRCMDDDFLKYVEERNDKTIADSLRNQIAWEAFPVLIYGSNQALVHSVFFPSRIDMQDVESFYLYLLRWLRNSFDHLAS